VTLLVSSNVRLEEAWPPAPEPKVSFESPPIPPITVWLSERSPPFVEPVTRLAPDSEAPFTPSASKKP
jgi:hypothetical protein